MSQGRARRLRRRRDAGADRPMRPGPRVEAVTVRLAFDLPAPDPAAMHVQMRMRLPGLPGLPAARRVRAGRGDPLARTPEPDPQHGA